MTKRSAVLWTTIDDTTGLTVAEDGDNTLTVGPRNGRYSWYVTTQDDTVKAHGLANTRNQAKVDALTASRNTRRT